MKNYAQTNPNDFAWQGILAELTTWYERANDSQKELLISSIRIMSDLIDEDMPTIETDSEVISSASDSEYIPNHEACKDRGCDNCMLDDTEYLVTLNISIGIGTKSSSPEKAHELAVIDLRKTLAAVPVLEHGQVQEDAYIQWQDAEGNEQEMELY